MIGTSTVVVLMPNLEAAAHVVPELGRLGVARPGIYAASLDRRGLADFSKHLGVSHFDLLDKADAQTRVFHERIPATRARYFTDRLAGKNVLLMLPQIENGGDVSAVLQRAGADFGPIASGDGFKDVRVPLRAEHLDVVKYMVQAGTVNLRKEIITEVERHDVTLVREELVMERTPLGVDGPVETIRIPLRHEEVCVAKKTVVTNEVVVRRQQFEEIRHIAEPVRYEQINVTKEGAVAMRDATPESFPPSEEG